MTLLQLKLLIIFCFRCIPQKGSGLKMIYMQQLLLKVKGSCVFIRQCITSDTLISVLFQGSRNRFFVLSFQQIVEILFLHGQHFQETEQLPKRPIQNYLWKMKWNPSIADTILFRKGVRYSEVSLLRGKFQQKIGDWFSKCCPLQKGVRYKACPLQRGFTVQ